ncbi:MAG TPA: glutaredoxin [Deltaproteobacteria bacterium]|nr:glutaredoxin [Deltaproteobacteria bacterium]
MVEEIKSREHFEKIRKTNKDFFVVIFYTNKSDSSLKALDVLNDLAKENQDMPVYAVNASNVRDIHPLFDVNSVPTVLILRDGKVANRIHGAQSKDYYQIMLSGAPVKAKAGGKQKKQTQPRVIVYTSPHCPWCNREKTYLMQNRIPFREIDVSKDQSAADRLVRKSGQLGTPQTEINGKIVVGFDKEKLDELLGIK